MLLLGKGCSFPEHLLSARSHLRCSTLVFAFALFPLVSLFKSRPPLQDALVTEENLPLTSDVPLRQEWSVGRAGPGVTRDVRAVPPAEMPSRLILACLIPLS